MRPRSPVSRWGGLCEEISPAVYCVKHILIWASTIRQDGWLAQPTTFRRDGCRSGTVLSLGYLWSHWPRYRASARSSDRRAVPPVVFTRKRAATDDIPGTWFQVIWGRVLRWAGSISLFPSGPVIWLQVFLERSLWGRLVSRLLAKLGAPLWWLLPWAAGTAECCWKVRSTNQPLNRTWPGRPFGGPDAPFWVLIAVRKRVGYFGTKSLRSPGI